MKENKGPSKDAQGQLEETRIAQCINSAEGYLLLSMYEDALAEVESVLALRPAHERALYLKGFVHLHLEEYVSAEKEFLALLVQDPTRLEIYIHLAYVYRRTKGLESAIETLEMALERISSLKEAETEKSILLPLANYNLACYYTQKEEINFALHHLTIAIELDAKYKEVASKDTDFDPIREDSRFLELMSRRRQAEEE